jgi:hypothetical protein
MRERLKRMDEKDKIIEFLRNMWNEEYDEIIRNLARLAILQNTEIENMTKKIEQLEARNG